MNSGIEILCDQIVGALLNGVYQGVLMAALAWLALKLPPRSNAATRHAVLFTTFVVVGALPVSHLLLGTKKPAEREIHEAVAVPGQVAVPPAIPDQEFDAAPLRIAEANSVEAPKLFALLREDPSRNEVSQMHREKHPENGENVDSEWSGFASAIWEGVAEEAVMAGKWISVVRKWISAAAALPVGLSLPLHWSVFLTAFWALAAVIRLGSLGGQYLALRLLKKRSAFAAEPVAELFERLRVEPGMKRRPRLLISSEISAPMAVGFIHPVVLVPSVLAASMDANQMEQVLRHELAHVSRRDDWANLAQQMLKAIFFFHPGVLWLSRALTVEREIACDDHVLSALNAPRSYALFLTEFASRAHRNVIAAAPAAWSNKSQLKERIDMILDTKRNASPRLARARASVLGIAALLAAGFVLHAGPRVVLAQEENASASKGQPEVGVPGAAPIAPIAPIAGQSAVISAPSGAVVITEDAESKPRRKSRARAASASAAALPRAEAAPSIEVAPAPPRMTLVAPSAPLLAEIPDGENRELRAPRPARVHNEDIERRLARVEKMLNELLAREKGKKHTDSDLKFNYNFDWKDGSGPHAELWTNGKLSDEEKGRIKEQAKREAEHAIRDAERAMREAQKAGNFDQMAALKEKLGHLSDAAKQSFDAQRKALEAQRHALEQQMQNLERQMQHLEEQRGRMEEQHARLEQQMERRFESDRNNFDKASKSFDKDKEKIKEKNKAKGPKHRGQDDEDQPPAPASEDQAK